MTDPREIQIGDVVQIDCEALSGVQFRVSDTEVEDIGITETFAVTLVSGSQHDHDYCIVGTTADSTATLQTVGENGDPHVVNWNDIELY